MTYFVSMQCHRQSVHEKMNHRLKRRKILNIKSFYVSFRFEQKVMDRRATDFLPFFGTDIGFCTMLKPQLSFNKSLNHLPYMDKMFGNFSHNWFISKGAKVGKANGNLQNFTSIKFLKNESPNMDCFLFIIACKILIFFSLKYLFGGFFPPQERWKHRLHLMPHLEARNWQDLLRLVEMTSW